MKSIVLNETQKDMLTEMAQDLFPEYGEEGYPLSEKVGLILDVPSNSYFVFFEKDSGTTRIPWLEFCIFYLQPKLKTYYSTITIKAVEGKYVENLHRIFKLKKWEQLKK